MSVKSLILTDLLAISLPVIYRKVCKFSPEGHASNLYVSQKRIETSR
jgi:hypothetical protein